MTKLFYVGSSGFNTPAAQVSALEAEIEAWRAATLGANILSVTPSALGGGLVVAVLYEVA